MYQIQLFLTLFDLRNQQIKVWSLRSTLNIIKDGCMLKFIDALSNKFIITIFVLVNCSLVDIQNGEIV